MKLSVLANLYGTKSLDETLSILSSLGVHTVEIGAGGYPGKAHCNPEELLADPKKFDARTSKYCPYRYTEYQKPSQNRRQSYGWLQTAKPYRHAS